MKTVVVGTRIDMYLKKALENEAKIKGMDKASLIRNILKNYISERTLKLHEVRVVFPVEFFGRIEKALKERSDLGFSSAEDLVRHATREFLKKINC